MIRRRDDTAVLLASYATSDVHERTHLARMQALLEVPGDPFARDHWDPGHFTASGFVLSPSHDQILLIFHGKLHRWLQPGGHVDPTDPDLISAARREVSEEVGLSELPLAFGPEPLDLDVHLIPSLGGQPPHEHFDVRFAFEAPSLSFTVGSDAAGARWYPLDDVNEELSDASVMRAIQRIRILR